MPASLADTLNSSAFVGLALWKTDTGFAASVEFQDGKWSPDSAGLTPSDAIAALFAPAPNATTIAALQELERGEGQICFKLPRFIPPLPY